jgi:hypothetical protein
MDETRRKAFGGERTGDRGFAVVGVLLLAAILLAIGMFGIRDARTEVLIAGNEMRSAKALALAEAGARHAVSLMHDETNAVSYMEFVNGYDQELSNGGTGGILATIGTERTVDGKKYRFVPADEGAAGDGYYVRMIDNYDERTGENDPTDDKDRRVRIVSRGQAGKSVRTLEVAQVTSIPEGWVIFGKRHAHLKGKGKGFNLTDSYNSALGDYYDPSVPKGNWGHVFSNGDIKLDEAQVNGNAVAGKKVSLKNGATVTGQIIQKAPPVILNPDPVKPCGPPYSGDDGRITGQYKFESDKKTGPTGNLTIDKDKSAALAPGVYCFRRLTLKDKATLTVNGPTQIWLTDKLDLGKGDKKGEKATLINTTKKAANLRVFSSYSGKGTGVRLMSGPGTYMVSYAPRARTTLRGSGDYFGMIVGKCVHVEETADIHFDETLAIDTLMPPKLDWRQVREY